MPPSHPRVSVVTSAYNGERYVAGAIESILSQTFRDFEYILVDDASTDGSARILADYAARDDRVFLVQNPVNLMLSGALNRALELATGDYFAVLDQDDLAHPERLARQVAYLDAHPEVGLLGSQVNMIDAEGSPLHPMSFPTDPETVRWIVFFGIPVLHSAAMMRRDLARQAGGYSVRRWSVNDYILFATLLNRTVVTNLPETLVSYRRHEGQTAHTHAKTQQAQAWLLVYSLLAERLQLQVGLNEVGIFFGAVRGHRLPDAPTLMQTADLLMQIHARYLEVENPGAQARARVDTDCARRLLLMAWVHRREQRSASRELLRQALALDPHLWQQPQTCQLLRRHRG